MNRMMESQLTRRKIVGTLAQSLLGVSVVPAISAFGESPQLGIAGNGDAASFAVGSSTGGKAKSVIYLFLTGGLSQIDSFDPKPEHENQGPIGALKTKVPGIQVAEFFPHMAKRMQHCCVLRTLVSTQGAHDEGRYFMRTSYTPIETIRHPGLGAWASHFLKEKKVFPQNVRIGEESAALGSGFLAARHSPLPIINPADGLKNIQPPSSLDSKSSDKRLERLRAMNQKFANKHGNRRAKAHVELFDEAVQLMQSKDLSAFDLNQAKPETRDRYGRTPLGQGLLLAKRLVEKGTRFIEVNDPGWDTHTHNFSRMNKKGTVLDQSLSALLEDLHSSGMLNETLVVVATEFGRTPKIVGERVGRDHFPKAFSCLLAGGGVKAGYAFGETDCSGMETLTRSVTVQQFNATIAHAMGLPLDVKVQSPSKRPFTIADKQEPVLEVFA